MKYLVEAANNDQPAAAIHNSPSTIDQLTFLDPAVGSGHILVEAFDTLYPMYLAEYYSPEEAVQCIIEKNLFGLDLDLRAVQLAQFALILKAAQYSRSVLHGKILPHIYDMPAPVHFTKEDIQSFLGVEGADYAKPLQDVLHLMLQAQNLGSIMQFDLSDEARAFIMKELRHWKQRKDLDLLQQELLNKLTPYLQVLGVLTQKYEVIAANPPYMQSKNFNASLKKYVERIYPNAKADLFAVFVEASINLVRSNGFVAEVTMQSWMFLSSFKKLRHQIVYHKSIIGLIDVGWNLFDNHSFPAAVVCFNNSDSYQKQGVYHDLTNVKVDREKLNEFWNNKNRYVVYQSDFQIIPDSPIAYWLTHSERALFSLDKIKNYGSGKKGLSTGNNDLFLRNWSEVNFDNTSIKTNNEKGYWVPLNKGGNFRKWYGNNETLIFWKDHGKQLKDFPGSVVRNEEYYFKPCITSGLVSYVDFSARSSDEGYIFEAGGTGLFVKNELYILGFLSTIIASRLLRALNPTINYNISDIENLPLVIENKETVEQIVLQSKHISKSDWDSRETSWNFKANPIVAINKGNLEQGYTHWLTYVSNNFFQLHANEEELNRNFIEIYGLQNELNPEIPLKDITILQDELDYEMLKLIQKPYEGQLVPVHADVVMQQLISYIVGCYMGRYRLDKPGLHIAHPNPAEEEQVPYFVKTGEERHYTFQIDDDAIIPLMGTNGNFTDDMLHRVKEFLSIIWGDDGLTANINFLQQQLDKNLEEYLVKDFWKYHVKTYSKKPIYWLFASKKGLSRYWCICTG
ncbi:MAG: BREX-1 system adenine-specific DNA-methyltransferase PglX [Chitinophagaceae bacterium]|nr:BREX-1 system adenine-specific DNA-methyltransferase PglX [Chitinophagaceae bacterium]